MKKNFLLISMFSLFTASVFVGCTSEYEEENPNKLQKIQQLVDEISEDYGMSGIIVNPDSIDKMNLSRAELEEKIKGLASIKGKYILQRDSETGILTSHKMIPTKRRVTKGYYESYSGSFDSNNLMVGGREWVEITVSYSYNRSAHSYVKASIKQSSCDASIKVTDHNFFGLIPSFSFNAILSMEGALHKNYNISGSYSASSQKGSITIK